MDADRIKAASELGREILAHYRAQRAAGNKAARFCTEAKYDQCCAWCVRIVDEEERHAQSQECSH